MQRCRVDAREPHWGTEFESSVGRRLGRSDLERRQPGGEAFAQKGVFSGGAAVCRAAGGPAPAPQDGLISRAGVRELHLEGEQYDFLAT